jgi:uncharacterized membrane protein YdbT with pleckstrin-like domain
MKKINKIIIAVMSMLLPLISNAQEITAEPQMADMFRSEGKIYVVITVISIIFVCLIGYLIYIDLKLRKLEKKQ